MTCDSLCQQAAQKLWRAALFALYAKSAMEGHSVVKADWQAAIQKLEALLPGVSGEGG